LMIDWRFYRRPTPHMGMFPLQHWPVSFTILAQQTQ
jgi:hypothetical protein